MLDRLMFMNLYLFVLLSLCVSVVLSICIYLSLALSLSVSIQGPASCVAFSRTGEYFASGGNDDQVTSASRVHPNRMQNERLRSLKTIWWTPSFYGLSLLGTQVMTEWLWLWRWFKRFYFNFSYKIGSDSSVFWVAFFSSWRDSVYMSLIAW